MINSKKGNIKIWLIPFNLSKLDNSNEEILLVKISLKIMRIDFFTLELTSD